MAELDEVLALDVGCRAAGPSTPERSATARGHLGEGWLIGHAINGGVLMALGLGAAASGLTAVRPPRRRSRGARTSCPRRSPARSRCASRCCGSGRTVSTAQVRVVQDGARPGGRAGADRRARSATLDRGRPRCTARPRHREVPAPDAVPAGDPRGVTGGGGDHDARPARRADRPVDRRVRRGAADAAAASSAPGCGCATAASPTSAMLPYAVDALMPVSFDLGVPGWAPTLELTGQVLGRPGSGVAPRRAVDRHRGRRPARRGRLRLGLRRAGSSPGPDSSPGCGCPPPRLLGVSPESPAVDAVTRLAELPGIPEQVEAAREACTRLRWHQALRRRIPEAAAESRVRGAFASAELEGASVPVDVVRDVMRGASTWSPAPDPVERDGARRRRGHGRDRARPRGRAHGAAAGAGAAPHGRGARARRGRDVARAAAAGRVRAARSSPTSGRRRTPREVTARLRDVGRRCCSRRRGCRSSSRRPSCTPSWPRCGRSCAATRSWRGRSTGRWCRPAGSTRPAWR